jgi:GT2 family glycosyltransferase
MDLFVIILNWNAEEDTLKCLGEIANWQEVSPVILVVDNNSTDNSVELIAQEYPDIYVIRNPENLGFAGGTNQGVAKALSLGNAPILLMNNDAFIDGSAVRSLLETLQNDRTIGFVVPLLYDAAQPDRLLSAGGKNPILHHQTRALNVGTDQTVQFVDFVSGTVVLIRPEVFHSAGLLDEDYFFSTEMADLCMRAKRYGYVCAVDTRAKAYHAVSRSSNLRDTLYVYYIVRNRFIFIRNSLYRFKLGFFIFWTIYSLILFVKLQLSGKAASAQAVWLGLIDGLRGRFGGQNERVLAACAKVSAAAS